MTATAIAQPTVFPTPKAMPNGKPAYISWENFQKRYLGREDGFTYEWTNGKIEKSPSAMTIAQTFIWDNLDDFFRNLAQNRNFSGKLLTEINVLLKPEMHRRPDVVFLTKEQIRNAVKQLVQVPTFVIEIISPNDKAEKVSRKVDECLDAGVSVVWNIYPESKKVYVFEKSGKVTVNQGEQLCSAESVIPGFSISVNEILK